jgi:flavin reductase (DIM6/NTAB) family NADH-FMN oxidoreductase RutF
MPKQRFGPEMISFPLPTVIVGALVEDRPNFNAIAYCGVAQSRPPMIAVSMDKNRYTHRGIIENETFSINIPSEDMIGLTNYVGTVSGLEADKSGLFTVFYGSLGTAPMIEECPAALACELVDRMDFEGKNDLLIGRVIESHIEEHLFVAGRLDLSLLKPLIFSREDHSYWALGRGLGTVDEISRSNND